MMRTRARARRNAFTFIELLVVVAVIAIMVALLLGAVSKILTLQARTETLSDITQMQQSLETAKAGYNNIDFLPSRLILFNDISNYRNIASLPAAQQPIAQQTADVLRRMFGKRFIQNGTVVNWGQLVPSTGPAYLRGSECLVFYLGGMQVGGRCIGFSRDPLNPTDTVSKDRLGPYFQFKGSRLASFFVGRPFEYADPYGLPFAYFAPSGPNNYAPQSIYGAAQLNDDNVHLGLVDAYNQGGAPKQYYNPNGVQLISAGPDGKKAQGGFGTGGVLALSGAIEPAAKDNLTNFSQTELGNGVE
jgi:prepilin-type N-terminal cleavage/methylation domain-containing protein